MGNKIFYSPTHLNAGRHAPRHTTQPVFISHFTIMQMSWSDGVGAKKSATYVGQHEKKSICLCHDLGATKNPNNNNITPNWPKWKDTHSCGLLLRHATKLLWGLVNLRTLRTSTKKKSQIIALNGATPLPPPVSSPLAPSPLAKKRENRLSKRACVRFAAGLFSYYIMMIIFIAASRDIFPMSPPSAQMAYNAPQTQRVHSKKSPYLMR